MLKWIALVGTALGLSGCEGCNAPQCTTDVIEPAAAEDLGVMSDQEAHRNLYRSIDVSDDVDAFQIQVVDEGLDGNPEITLDLQSLSDENLEFTVEVRCVGRDMTSFSCGGSDKVPSGVGASCTGSGTGISFDINYDCDDALGDTDNADVRLIVSAPGLSPDFGCLGYELTVDVD